MLKVIKLVHKEHTRGTFQGPVPEVGVINRCGKYKPRIYSSRGQSPASRGKGKADFQRKHARCSCLKVAIFVLTTQNDCFAPVAHG